MKSTAFKLESLLEIHEIPLMVVNASLQVVAINQTFEQVFEQSRHERIGQRCCPDQGQCRHQQMFQSLEPYAGVYSVVLSNQQFKMANVRGLPLIDVDGILYLVESLSLLNRTIQATQQGMVGSASNFMALKSRLQQAAQLTVPVLLTGETGTGKELAAEFIHQLSAQSNQDLVIADCTVLSEELFESELFGHEKGAFTGATSTKKGLFELADNGTLFLDEIGELPLSQQAKLLRALERGQFRRVGGTATLKANVRVIAATHRNLAQMVEQGLFREDLFYRLSVFPIQIPCLRQRREDIPLLVEHFLSEMGDKQKCTFDIDALALKKLLQHDWPGNVRELKNCVQLACGLCQHGMVKVDDIHFTRTLTSEAQTIRANAFEGNSGSPLEQYEATFISHLITKYQGNRKLMAAEMNISERTLYRKLNRLNLS